MEVDVACFEPELQVAVRKMTGQIARTVDSQPGNLGKRIGDKFLRRKLRVFPISAGWDESSVSWNTRPTRTGPAIVDAEAISSGTWYEFDLSSHITGNGTYTLELASVSSDAVRFSSRETTNQPHLVIVVE